MECSIIQILRSIEGSRATFRTLGSPEFRLTSNGELLYRVGNSAIVFTIKLHGRWHCAKCYTAPLERRKVIYGEKLLCEELYIPLDDQRGVWLDVLVDEWIEGETLSDYIHQAVALRDRIKLEELSKNFDNLALSLLQSQEAHGDITGDNIIVTHSGTLHLIDFDNSFRPSLSGLKSLELGTEAYQHPERGIDDFDRTIDDYSLALISTALSLTALRPEIFEQRQEEEGLLFNPREIIQGRSSIHTLALSIFEKEGAIVEYRIAELLASATPTLAELYPLMHYKVAGVQPNAQPTTIFRRNSLWGYLNDFNREVIPPIFDAALSFSEGLAAVRINTTWHYIDSTGRTAINCQEFDQIKSCKQGKARVKRGGKWIEIEVKR